MNAVLNKQRLEFWTRKFRAWVMNTNEGSGVAREPGCIKQKRHGVRCLVRNTAHFRQGIDITPKPCMMMDQEPIKSTTTSSHAMPTLLQAGSSPWPGPLFLLCYQKSQMETNAVMRSCMFGK